MAMQKFENPINVSPEGDGKSFVRDIDRLERWHAAETEFWTPIRERLESDAFFQPFLTLDPILLSLSHLENEIAAYRSQQPENRPGVEDALQSRVNEYLAQGLSSESESGQRVADFSQTNTDAAWIEIFRTLGGKKNRKQPGAAIGFSEIKDVVAFMDGWIAAHEGGIDARNAIAPHKRSLSSLKNRWSDQFNDAYDEIRQSREVLERETARVKRLAAQLLCRQRRMLRDHRVRMAEMRTSFSTEMKLRAAEKFWGQKRRVSRKRSLASLRKFYVTGGLGLAALFGIYAFLFWMIERPQSLNIAHSILFLIPTLAYVWLLRIYATEYRSYKNLADDAEEREAMVMTFKALEFEQRVGDEERLVILNALFRPHGQSGEESVPLPVWEAIVGKMGKSP